MKINPNDPRCPECKRGLPEPFDNIRYEDKKCTMNIHACPHCRAVVGLVLMDEPLKPGDKYVVKKVK